MSTKKSFKTGAKTKIFLLSSKEYSCTDSSHGKNGAILDYFNNIDTSITTDRLKAPKYNGSSIEYWTRDVSYNSSSDYGDYVGTNGDFGDRYHKSNVCGL
jgi:hypothetical protein